MAETEKPKSTTVADPLSQLVRQGEGWFEAGKIDQARELFERIVRDHPDCKEAYNNLGVLCVQAGEMLRARKMFQRALVVDPDFEDALANMQLVSDSDDPEAVRPEPASSDKPRVNFEHPLPSVGYVDDRKEFTVDFCRGKKVLHIGCVDAGMTALRRSEEYFLHDLIAEVATELIGIDVDQEGLDILAESGHEVHRIDLEQDRPQLYELTPRVDAIVIPEVLEHLCNPGLALENLAATGFTGDILITTPNAFSYRTNQAIMLGIEFIHPDHNCWFSPTTLVTLLRKHRFEVRRMLMYYYRSADKLGEKFDELMKTHPHYGDGIIAITRII